MKRIWEKLLSWQEYVGLSIAVYEFVDTMTTFQDANMVYISKILLHLPSSVPKKGKICKIYFVRETNFSVKNVNAETLT